MKNILTLIAIFLASNIYAQKYVLLEINSEWNLRNSAKIDKIKNVEYRIAYLEEQTPAFRKKIKSIPMLAHDEKQKNVKHRPATLFSFDRKDYDTIKVIKDYQFKM